MHACAFCYHWHFLCASFKDESGWTPLHLAAGNGNVDIIKWLTSAGRDDLDVETPTGYTPTHVAAMNGHINAAMVS